MAIISGKYKIVDQQCTSEQVHGLLRKYKDVNDKTKSEIRLSGTKPELIANLKRVESIGLIPPDEVYKLIQESEENGQQHVYFFKPSAIKSDLLKSPDEFASALFGESWGPDYFPTFERHSKKLEWSDFRIGVVNKRNDWLAKIYGHERRMKLQGRRKEDVSATSYREILDYEAEDYNTVHLARWNSPDLLEVRIDQVGMQKAGTAKERLESVWELIEPAVKTEEVTPWDLRDTMTKMLTSRDKYSEVFQLGTVRLRDGSFGVVQFDPNDTEETIDDDDGRKKAIDSLLKNRSKGTRLAITWNPNDSIKELKKPLLTVLTGDDFNCLAVSSNVSAKVMDYVTNKLRQFSS